ncbi:MAG: inorganic phosphate transporter [Bacteroidetes bacterium]|nr:inorganic phosphate transporter [Bacteroidota bacterium]
MALLVTVIILALIFDFINGFHDSANSIATIVSTKVLTPLQAVIWAAVFNFVAFFIFRDHGVANTIAKTVYKEYITLPVVLSGLIGAIIWNLATWWYGIPSSSSHTLIGGFAGAAMAHAGIHSINPEPVIKTTSFIILAPVIGMIIAYITSIWLLNSFRKGVVPKIISLAIMICISWYIWSVLDLHPDKAGIKGEIKTVEINGIKKDVIKSKVFDATPEETRKAWNDAMTKNKATVSGTDRIVASRFAVDSISKTPVTVIADFKDTVGETRITLSFMRDTMMITKKNDSTLFKHAKNFLADFGKKTTGKGKAEDISKILLAKENFKWLLLGTILIILSIFTLFLSTLNNARASAWFKRLQLLSSAAFSIGHGGNDAQKVMGIITAALIASNKLDTFEHMPIWVPLSCYTAIALGTLSGGWKIIKTMGTKITKLTPFEGVAASTAGAITLFFTENLKIPVSTTHTMAGSVIGAGATKRLSAVRWGVTFNLLWAWILTIPVSAALSAIVYYIVNACM